MTKGRLEAFSDAVIAVIITIMVLELKVPHGTGWSALQPLLPVFLTYVLSFVYIGIYRKGWLSLVLYAAAIPLAFVNQWISDAIYITVALIWLVPDKRIESTLTGH